MPSELWAIFRKNRHLLHDLPALGAAVIEQWINMKYGADVLIIVVQHTFGGDLKFNPHLHILLSAGGLQKSTGRWIPELHLNKDALMKMWRYAVVDHLQRAIKARVLEFELRLQDLHRLISTAYRSEAPSLDHLHRQDCIEGSFRVRYAARYVRRPPIAEWRILKVTDGQVEFVAKDTRNETLIRIWCTLDRFVRLLAAHVPDHYRHAIRYFGLLAARVKGQRDAGLFHLSGQQRRPRPRRLSWRESVKKHFRSTR